MKGSQDGRFDSEGKVTRAQAAVIILNTLQRLEFVDGVIGSRANVS